MFRAIVFAVFACGFRPRSALEIDDAAYGRLDKIMTIIGECRYGIHDLSRIELDELTGLPRFNMPFELGLFLAAKRFGGEDHARKRAIVLECEPYRYQRFISDLNGMDISAHNNEPTQSVALVRDWLVNVSRRRIAATPVIVEAYQHFAAGFAETAAALGFDPDNVPHVEFEFIVADWLLGYPQ